MTALRLQTGRRHPRSPVSLQATTRKSLRGDFESIKYYERTRMREIRQRKRNRPIGSRLLRQAMKVLLGSPQLQLVRGLKVLLGSPQLQLVSGLKVLHGSP